MQDNKSIIAKYEDTPYYMPPEAPDVSTEAKVPVTEPKAKEPFHAAGLDAWFALAGFALAAVFFKLLFVYGTWEGYGASLFVLLYAGALLAYAGLQKIKAPKYSWYWLGILVLLGISCVLWPSGSLAFSRELMLFGVAVYWSGALFGIGVEKKTGNFLALDALNLVFVVPFANFTVAVRSIAQRLPKRQADDQSRKQRLRRLGSVLVGLALLVPVLCIVLPMLMAADSGGFNLLLGNLFEGIFRFLNSINIQFFVDIFFIALIGLYMNGLIIGSAHKRCTGKLDVKRTQKGLLAFRVLPRGTVAALLAGVILLYAAFIGGQVPYFFSAFGGTLPAGYTNYAEYARQGFFELCRISGINLGLLLCVNVCSRTPRRDSRLLRWLNVALAVATLLLLVTAFSKMALYINTYGYTPKRVLTSVFMAWMAVVWAGVILLQFRGVSVMRLAAVAGSLMFAVLCLVGLDRSISTANAKLYLAGEIPYYETSLLYNGIDYTRSAEVLQTIERRYDHRELERVMELQFSRAWYRKGTHRDTVAYMLTRAEAVEEAQSHETE